MAKWVFINGSFEREETALLHFKDLAFQRGYGIFDFFRLVNNTPLFFEDHLQRFRHSAQGLHLPFSYDDNGMRTVINSLIGKNGLPESGIRLSLTGGYSEDGFTPGKPNFIISQQRLTPLRKEQIEQGIFLTTYPYQRQLPHIKTIDYLMAIWLQPLRIQAGADDILYHSNGFITECPRSNFFLVTGDDRIVTPSENILEGITRAKVIQLAKEGYAVEQRPVHLDEIKTAKEAFITSTTKRILRVAQIDESIFSEAKVSTDLLKRFRSAHGG